MRLVGLMIVLLGLAGVAVMAFVAEQWMVGIAFLAAALAIVLPALVGDGFGTIADANLMIEFVRDPGGTVVDEITGRLEQEADQPKIARPATASETATPSFDADAALARYMAQRETGQIETRVAQGIAPLPAAPVRTFGRKQA